MYGSGGSRQAGHVHVDVCHFWGYGILYVYELCVYDLCILRMENVCMYVYDDGMKPNDVCL